MRLTFVVILLLCSFPGNSQWIQTNGPEGGSIISIASSGTDLFAATNKSVWHSDDDGNTWTRVTDPISDVEQLIYKDSMLIAIGGLVSRSTDLGNTWTWGGSLNVGPITSSVVSGNDIFVGAWGFGVYRSSDNGVTWTIVNNGMGPEEVQSLAVNGSTLYAGTEYNGIFKSTNNGNTWVSDSVGLNGSAIRSLAVLNNEVFAGSPYQGVFRNIGGMWLNVNNGLTNLSAIELGTMGGNLVAGSANGVVSYSSNSGASWNVSSSVISGEYISDFQIHNNFLFLGCWYDGVYRSSDLGVTWIETNNNLISSSIICMTSMDSTLIAGLGNGIHMSSDQGNTWVKMNSGLTEPHVLSLLVVDSFIFATTYYGFYRSDDHGNSWIEPAINAPNDFSVLAHFGDYLLCSSHHHLYRSLDNGVNWSLKSIPGLTTYITTMAVSDSLIFVGSAAGLFISADSGSTWIQSTNGIGNASINSLFVTGNQVYASTTSPFLTYRTTDNGNTWNLVGNGLNGNIISWASSGSNIFAGGTYYVFRSTDYGNTWSPVSTYPLSPSAGLTILDSVVYGGYFGVYKNENLICNNTTQTISLSSCGPYTSPSGNYAWTTSGTYADTIPNAAGCDSILTINLTVLPAIVVNITAQGPITFCQGDSVILAGTPGFGSYQWRNRLYSIPGANSSSFTVRASGRYSCIAQDGICSDTSNIIVVHVPCISVDPAEEKSMHEIPASLEIYPNPGNGIFNMHAPDGDILIYDNIGKLVSEIKWQQNSEYLNLSHLNDGIYLLYFNDGESRFAKRLQISR